MLDVDRDNICEGGIDDRSWAGARPAEVQVKSGEEEEGERESDITRATRSRIVATFESLPGDSRSAPLPL